MCARVIAPSRMLARPSGYVRFGFREISAAFLLRTPPRHNGSVVRLALVMPDSPPNALRYTVLLARESLGAYHAPSGGGSLDDSQYESMFAIRLAIASGRTGFTKYELAPRSYARARSIRSFEEVRITTGIRRIDD
jgi:hypothetical protein